MRVHLLRAFVFVCLLGALALAWLNLAQFTAAMITASVLAAVALLPSFSRRWRQPGKISPQQLQTLFSQGKSPLVIDVRNSDEFVGERGHIEGAVLFSLPELDARIDELQAHRACTIVLV